MAQMGRIGNKKRRTGHDNDDEKKLSRLRETVNAMDFLGRLSRRAIARDLAVSRTFVTRWSASPDQDFTSDMRGWTKDIRRKWDISVERSIRDIYRHLAEDPRQFYTGATAIAQEWRSRYPGSTPPPLRTIGKIMSDLGLS